METRARLNAVFPIGDTDPQNLPVPDVGQAIPFYTDRLGFTLQPSEDDPATAAVLVRDSVRLRLARSDADPEQASCYIDVTDLDALHREYLAQGVNVSEHITAMDYDAKQYRVFWAKDEDGICYCLGTPLPAA